MADLGKCLAQVAEFLKVDPKDSRLKSTVNDLRVMRENAKDVPEFEAQVKEYLAGMKEDIAIKKKSVVENFIKEEKQFKLFDENRDIFEKDPVRYFQAILVGDDFNIKDGNLSIESRSKTNAHEYMNNLIMPLEDKGIMKFFLDPENGRNIDIELYEIQTKGDVGKTGSVEAKEAAMIINDALEFGLRKKQKAGSSIKRLEGRVRKMQHDGGKIKEMGFKDWSSMVLKHVDHAKSFGHGNPKEILKQMYKKITATNIHSASKLTDDLRTISRPNSLDKRLSRSRTLHWKDGASFHDYNIEAGMHDVANGVTRELERAATDEALIAKFGTNDSAMFEKLKQRVINDLENSDNIKGLEAMQSDSKKLSNLFNTVKGLSSMPGVSTKAKFGRNARAALNMSKLGGAVISAGADLGVAAGMLRARSGKGFLSSTASLIDGFFKGLNKQERMLWANKLRIFGEDITGDALARLSGHETGPGIASGLQRKFFKLTGLNAQTSAAKFAVGRQFSMELADFSTKNFDQLSQRVTANLDRYGLGNKEWDMLRNSVEDINGTLAMTPEAVGNISDDIIQKYIDANGLKRTSVLDVKDDISGKLAQYINDSVDLAVPTPGAKERSFLLQGTTEDETLGQMLRFVSQFKSFPLTMGRVMKNIAFADPSQSAKSMGDLLNIKDTIRGKNFDTKGLVGTIVGLTSIGYMVGAMKDILSNKTPADPFDPKTFQRAFIQGGGGGLYADFLFGGYAKDASDHIVGLMGPGVGVVEDVIDLGYRAAKGQKVARKTFDTMYRNLPLNNLWYSKGVTDYLIMQNIQEFLEPGYKGKMEGWIRKNPGLFSDRQEMIFD